LFAALDIANGSVLTQCKAQHRHQELLSFLRQIEANIPADLDVHLICDNYGRIAGGFQAFQQVEKTMAMLVGPSTIIDRSISKSRSVNLPR
jgi:hypothetical protein